VRLAEASSLVWLDFRKSKFSPSNLTNGFLDFWTGASGFLVLLVSWYFWFSGTSGTGEN
jgi:hypothetical protein